jgi:hypothetical protein
MKGAAKEAVGMYQWKIKKYWWNKEVWNKKNYMYGTFRIKMMVVRMHVKY